jgi:hypothetical protein
MRIAALLASASVAAMVVALPQDGKVLQKRYAVPCAGRGHNEECVSAGCGAGAECLYIQGSPIFGYICYTLLGRGGTANTFGICNTGIYAVHPNLRARCTLPPVNTKEHGICVIL